MTTRERLRGILAGLVLVVGVVLSPLRAAAATIPMLVAYDAAVRPAATTRVDAGPSLRPDRGSTPEYVYDDAPAGHDGGTKLGAERGTGVVRAYDRALQLTERRELVEGLIYDAPFATTAAEATANEVPSVLARVIPGEGPFPTLGPPGRADVFVTAAEDIAGMTPEQIAQRLTISPSSSFTVIEFETPAEGLASPVLRSDPGFIGGGQTAGGAREFVLPNGPVPAGATVRVVQ